MVYNLFDTKSTGSIKSMSDQQLADELQKPIIRKFFKKRVYSLIKNSIRGANLADIALISKYNKGIKYLLCAIDLFSKYALVVPLKDKRGITIVNPCQSILRQFKKKTKKIWVDQGSEFCNSSFKKWFKENHLEMYWTYIEGKSVVAERFIGTWKNKIFENGTAVSKNVYFDILDDDVDKYNNTYHRTIIMKPIDVTSNFYVECNVDSNEKDPKSKIGDHVRISKDKNILLKDIFLIGQKKFLWSKKLKKLYHGLMW